MSQGQPNPPLAARVSGCVAERRRAAPALPPAPAATRSPVASPARHRRAPRLLFLVGLRRALIVSRQAEHGVGDHGRRGENDDPEAPRSSRPDRAAPGEKEEAHAPIIAGPDETRQAAAAATDGMKPSPTRAPFSASLAPCPALPTYLDKLTKLATIRRWMPCSPRTTSRAPRARSPR